MIHSLPRSLVMLMLALALVSVTPETSHSYRTTKYFMLEVYPVDGVPFRTLSHMPPMSYFHYYGGEANFISVYLLYSITASNNNLATFQQLVEDEGLGPANYLPLDPEEAEHRGKGRPAEKRLWHR